jgi:RNA polymerase sigma factor (sigma-70 family)
VEASALKPQAGLAGGHGRSPLLRLQSDERLIALVRRGNHGAFEVLVARYQSRLLAFCRHMLGSREDAEDVLQEVFAAAFNAILADSREINVRPWLYRIARNRSLNHLRRVQPIGVDSMDVHLSEHGVTTADKVDRRETLRELVADVQELPETQRTALLLREIDALSYEQIAEAMETTIPSVKSLLVRARVSLAEAAEARQLSCDDVRLELGEIAEGLRRRTTPPVRRHLRACDRCTTFRSQLRATNKGLALLLPVGPLLLAKKLLLAHLGLSASAGGGTATGTAAMGAAAGTAASSGAGGGFVSAGIGAVATKAAASIAAAALVTASAVEIEHRAPVRTHHRPAVIAQATPVRTSRSGAAVVRHAPAAVQHALDRSTATGDHRHAAGSKRDAATAPQQPATTTTAAKPVTPPVTTTTAAPPAPPGETQVETSTTELPPATPPVATTTPTDPVPAPPTGTTTAAVPPPPPPPAPPADTTTTPAPPAPPKDAGPPQEPPAAPGGSGGETGGAPAPPPTSGP